MAVAPWPPSIDYDVAPEGRFLAVASDVIAHEGALTVVLGWRPVEELPVRPRGSATWRVGDAIATDRGPPRMVGWAKSGTRKRLRYSAGARPVVRLNSRRKNAGSS
jgi:hypothetical protein